MLVKTVSDVDDIIYHKKIDGTIFPQKFLSKELFKFCKIKSHRMKNELSPHSWLMKNVPTSTYKGDKIRSALVVPTGNHHLKQNES